MGEMDVNRTLFFSASFVGATFPTNFLIERELPHRPARLRTVVGNSGERESSSASAAPRKLDAAIGECRLYHLCWAVAPVWVLRPYIWYALARGQSLHQ